VFTSGGDKFETTGRRDGFLAYFSNNLAFSLFLTDFLPADAVFSEKSSKSGSGRRFLPDFGKISENSVKSARFRRFLAARGEISENLANLVAHGEICQRIWKSGSDFRFPGEK